MGSVPLILAAGPGASSRSALGVVIFSGVSFATFFTLFIVPAVYNLMARGTGSPNAVAHRLHAMQSGAAT
jgi:multidrug efflux pump